MLEFAIVSAGFSGIAMARALSALEHQRWMVFEKAAEVGGTWRENHYPGAACDVPSHLYSLAGAANPHWSRLYPRQAEIQQHLIEIAAPLKEADRIRFNHRLLMAEWQAARQCWRLCFEGREPVQARTLVLGLGGLHIPSIPEIKGAERFTGPNFHSACWRHEVELRGKKVAVIGTGASAVQFVPELARRAAQLTVFQRTPAWVIPRNDFALPRQLQQTFARAPWLRKSFRGAIFTQLELLSSALLHRRTGIWGRALARWHLRRQVKSPQLRTMLTPDYPIGCKRVLVSDDYYPALQQPNVALCTTPIAQIESDAIRLIDGSVVSADVLVYGTGFKPLDLLSEIQIRGRDGIRLDQAWRTRPQAHLGVSPHGFPNLHLLLGPNTALGHNSVLYMIESQVEHILRLHQLRLARRAVTVEATERAQRAYLQRVDRQFAASAWNGGCRSWYLDDQGQNIALWTGTCLAYRRLLRRLNSEDYCFA